MSRSRLLYGAFASATTLALFAPAAPAQKLGDPGWVFDASKYDDRVPAMREWAKAGVRGGIPTTLPIRERLRPPTTATRTAATRSRPPSTAPRARAAAWCCCRTAATASATRSA